LAPVDPTWPFDRMSPFGIADLLAELA